MFDSVSPLPTKPPPAGSYVPGSSVSRLLQTSVEPIQSLCAQLDGSALVTALAKSFGFFARRFQIFDVLGGDPTYARSTQRPDLSTLSSSSVGLVEGSWI